VQDAERDELFEMVSATLVSAGLGWIVAQVREEIADGQVGTKEVTAHGLGAFTLIEPAMGGAPPRMPRSAALAVAPFTSLGRLEALASATRLAVVQSVQLQREILQPQFFSIPPGSITFFDEVTGTASTLEPGSPDTLREGGVAGLLAAIDALLEEARR